MDSDPALPDPRAQTSEEHPQLRLPQHSEADPQLGRPLSGRCEVQIRHDREIYRLQVTRNGKLILIK